MTDAQLVKLQSQEQEYYEKTAIMLRLTLAQFKERIASGNMTREEASAEMSKIFHDIALDCFSDVFVMSETEVVFAPYDASPGSRSSFRMTFRHKLITIQFASPSEKDDSYRWAFRMEPSSSLEEDFQQWQKHVSFSDASLLRNTVLTGRSVTKPLASGKEALLALLTEIDEKHKTEIADFEAIKARATQQRVIVEEATQRVKEWNDTLCEAVRVSEDKLKKLLAEAEKEAWVWPPGKTLTLFEFVSQAGGCVENGIPYIQRESAWSLSDVPDEGGYFNFLPEIDNCYEDESSEQPVVIYRKEARKIKPTLLIEIRKVEFTNSEDLPLELRTLQYLSLEASSFWKLACKDSGYIEATNHRSKVLRSEGASLKKVPGFPGRDFWHHVSLGWMPIDEIRSAAV